MTLTDEEIRAEFEAVCKASQTVKFPLGVMTINGRFHHYMDPDTDNAWLGFRAGFKRCLKKMEKPCA